MQIDQKEREMYKLKKGTKGRLSELELIIFGIQEKDMYCTEILEDVEVNI